MHLLARYGLHALEGQGQGRLGLSRGGIHAVVHHDDRVAHLLQFQDGMGAHEACPTRHEHYPRLAHPSATC